MSTTVASPWEPADPGSGLVPEGAEWDSGLYRIASAQFERTADMLALGDEVRERLRSPRRSLTVNFPVRLDDGRVRNFTGYRVQHTLTMGPTKGGMRYSPSLDLGECAALAMWMTWKCVLLRLPYGGAKGGVRCDAALLSLGELERLTRRFAAELIPIIGPATDIPAPDMATSEREMAWFMDTYSQQVGNSVPGVVTGKPEVLGGIAARSAATGLGVVHIADRVLAHHGRPTAGERFVVQGFGNVGRVAAIELHALGGLVVGVSDVGCGLVNPTGLDIPAVDRWVSAHGRLAGCPVGEEVAPEDVLEAPCDVLIPAAMEQQLTEGNADRLRCSLVVEAANGPTTPAAEEILRARDIVVVPDVLANAGGVVVSYFEWVQGLQRLAWDHDDVLRRLRDQLSRALTAVLDFARERDIDLRTAALGIALQRVAHAAELRGVYP